MSETNTATREFPICRSCGSRHVKRDAWATWSDEEQDWELGQVFDDAYCEDCDAATLLDLANEDGYRQRRCQYLNDRLRNGPGSGHDRVVITEGVTLVSETFLSTAIAAVAAFDAFTEDNDPHREHDFGALEVEGERLFFKVDYYNLALVAHSPDKTDPAVTARVLTIMLAHEY